VPQFEDGCATQTRSHILACLEKETVHGSRNGGGSQKFPLSVFEALRFTTSAMGDPATSREIGSKKSSPCRGS